MILSLDDMDPDYIQISNANIANYMHYQYLISILIHLFQHTTPVDNMALKCYFFKMSKGEGAL